MSDPTSDLWSDLQPPTASGALSGRTPPGRADDLVKVALDHEWTAHLLVAAEAGDAEITQPSIRGLEVKLDTLKVGDAEPALYFDLSCRDPGLLKNFLVLAKDVLDGLGSGPSRPVLIAILRQWRRFWSNRPGEMTNEAIAGLFGELWFMQHWLGPPSKSMLEVWLGPDRDRHDFAWPTASVEVKTTTVRSDGPGTHMISGLSQLQDPEQGDLYLFSVRIAADKLASQSLRASIEKVRLLLQSDPDALVTFNDGLAKSGVSPGDMDRYDARFRVVAEELYKVGPGFPRITDGSFSGGLPVGVEEVNYSVNLTACSKYLVESTPGPIAAGLRSSIPSHG